MPRCGGRVAASWSLERSIPPRLIATEGFGTFYLTNGYYSCGGAVEDRGCSVPPDQIAVRGYDLVLDAEILGYGGSDRLLRLRRELLPAWLNLVSGRVSLSAPVKVDRQAVTVLRSSPGTALGLLRAIETRLSKPIQAKDIDTLRETLIRFNETR